MKRLVGNIGAATSMTLEHKFFFISCMLCTTTQVSYVLFTLLLFITSPHPLRLLGKKPERNSTLNTRKPPKIRMQLAGGNDDLAFWVWCIRGRVFEGLVYVNAANGVMPGGLEVWRCRNLSGAKVGESAKGKKRIKYPKYSYFVDMFVMLNWYVATTCLIFTWRMFCNCNGV